MLIRKLFPPVLYPKLVGMYHSLRFLLLHPFYHGTRYECPLCRGRFRKLLASGLDLPVFREQHIIGGGYRRNSLCPRCHASDRERLIFLYLKQKTTLFRDPAKVLHVAPERNLQRKLKNCSSIKYVSADLDSPLAQLRMDITHICLGANTFDIVICNHVLEHVPDDGKAMTEIFRVLRPGGWAILQVPISLTLGCTFENSSIRSPEERERLFGQHNHVRIYGQDYERRLQRAGFCVEKYSFVKDFGESKSEFYGLLKDEILFVCRKPSGL